MAEQPDAKPDGSTNAGTFKTETVSGSRAVDAPIPAPVVAHA